MKKYLAAAWGGVFVAAATRLAFSPGASATAALPQAPPAASAATDDPTAPVPDKDAVFAAPATATGPAPILEELGIKKTRYPVPTSRVIFVARNGDAKASGADKNKPTTVAQAIENAPPGATVVFRGGDYRAVDTVPVRHRLTLQPYPGETAWIKGSDVVTGWQKENAAPGLPAVSRWSVPWDKKFNHKADKSIDARFPRAADLDMVFVSEKSLKQAGSLAELTEAGSFYVDTDAKRLYITTDPVNKTVEVTARLMAFNSVGKDGANTTGTIVRGLGFAHFAETGIAFIGPKCVLENNTFAWNGKGGARLNGPDHIVRGNTFACNGQVGFQGTFCGKLLFENNRVAFNNIERFATTWGAAGAKTIVSKDMVIRNNVYERNFAAAIWMDISCMRPTVINNTVRYNEGLGIFDELGHEGIIAFNVCHENSVGIMLADTSGVRVWNNTLVGNNKSILVKDSPRVNDGAAEGNSFYNNFKKADSDAGARWITRDNEIKNNVMVGGGRAGAKGVFVDATFAAGSDTSAQMIRAMDANVYVRLPQRPPTVLLRWDPGMAKPLDFPTLAAFQSAYPGYESKSVLREQTSGDLFIRPEAGDFRLKPGSGVLTQASEALPDAVAAAARAAGVRLENSISPVAGALPLASAAPQGVSKNDKK